MGCCVQPMLFPKPEPTYTKNDKSLIWITNSTHLLTSGDKGHRFPCKVVNSISKKYKRAMLYFHGNAEDIGVTEYFLREICEEFEAVAVAVEYPTYGAYSEMKAVSESVMRSDALSAYDQVRDSLKLAESQMIVFGRSMGSGPASYLAAHRPAALFLLFSPYLSIKGVAREHVGCIACCLCCYSFDNLAWVKTIRTPTFIIHGEIDEVINNRNGKQLYEASPAPKKRLVTPLGMSHNGFDLNEDFIRPCARWLREEHLLEDKVETVPIAPLYSLGHK